MSHVATKHCKGFDGPFSKISRACVCGTCCACRMASCDCGQCMRCVEMDMHYADSNT